MSFFDDEPTRAAPRAGRPAPRPRKPAGGSPRPGAPSPRRTGGGGRGGGPTTDDQTLLVRRLVAGGGGFVILLLLVFGVKGCLNGRTDRALKDYTRNVATVMEANKTDVSEQFFELLNGGADNPGDLEQSVRSFAAAADEGVKQASAFSVPDQMARAQSALMLTLHLRATAITKIADQITTAQAKGRSNASKVEDALSAIAGQMRAFDASDVIYSQRVVPYIEDALKEADVSGPDLPAGQFLPDIGWLDKDQIAGVLNAQRKQGGTGASPEPAKGTHGHGLVSTSVGNTVLQPKPAVNRVPATGAVTFNVKVANQGENNESDVVVKVTARQGTAKAVTATKTITRTTTKTETTAAVAMTNPPVGGDGATVTVTIAKVPGEETTTNNTSDYTVVFEG